jgi:hypothetical protein
MLEKPNVIKLLCALSGVAIWWYAVKDVGGGGVKFYPSTRVQAEQTFLIIFFALIPSFMVKSKQVGLIASTDEVFPYIFLSFLYLLRKQEFKVGLS